MDMFTDVDIFADLLDAAQRHVPIYILLDEQNAHHFVAMVTSCKVNLDMVHVRPDCLPVIRNYFYKTLECYCDYNYSHIWTYYAVASC